MANKNTLPHLTGPNLTMDVRLLDSVKDQAWTSLEKLEATHGTVLNDDGDRVTDPNWTEAPDDHWKAHTILTPDIIRLGLGLAVDQKVAIPRHVKAAVEMFLLTEDGIVWYGRDVGNIFNPQHIVPAMYDPGQQEDPHELFVRDWVAQEAQHASVEHLVAMLMDVDMVQLEATRYKFIRGDLLPKPINTPQGAAYTALQENNTRTPYSNLIIELDKLIHQAQTEGKTDHGLVLATIKDIYKHIRSDENRHHIFIRDTLFGAVHSDDKSIASYAVAGMYDQYVATEFMMPGQSIDRFMRLAAPIARAGIFTPDQSMRNMHDIIKRAQLEKLVGLTRIGGIAVDGLMQKQQQLASALTV